MSLGNALTAGYHVSLNAGSGMVTASNTVGPSGGTFVPVVLPLMVTTLALW